MAAADRRRRYLDASQWSTDAMSSEDLQRSLGRYLGFYLDAIENMDAAGELTPGLRSLAERHGIVLSTAHQWVRAIEVTGVWEIIPRAGFKAPGRGCRTNRYRVKPEYLKATL